MIIAMFISKRLKKKSIDFMFDHPGLKATLELIGCSIVTITSAFVFSFGFNVFVNPNFNAIAGLGVNIENIRIFQLANSGSSGLAQCFLILCKILGFTKLSDETFSNVVYWLIYLGINTPLVIFAFFKIGKRFASFTCLNVVSSTIFGIILKSNDPYFFINQVSSYFAENAFLRVVLAGASTGISSGLAYLIEASAGGTDIIGYYISEKKSVLVGKYNMAINICIIVLFCSLSCVKLDPIFGKTHELAAEVAVFIMTFIYIFVVSAVIDKINTQNSKVLVQIFTNDPSLGTAIIAAIPHSCTIEDGVGGYSGDKKIVIYMSVRKKEVRLLQQICKEKDEHVFINIIPLVNVQGRFSRKPIK